jgi:hypothetical protein
MSKLTIKLYFSDEIRKITINKDTKYSEFLNQITEFLKKKENKITLEIVEKNYTFQYMETSLTSLQKRNLKMFWKTIQVF